MEMSDQSKFESTSFRLRQAVALGFDAALLGLMLFLSLPEFLRIYSELSHLALPLWLLGLLLGLFPISSSLGELSMGLLTRGRSGKSLTWLQRGLRTLAKNLLLVALLIVLIILPQIFSRYTSISLQDWALTGGSLLGLLLSGLYLAGFPNKGSNRRFQIGGRERPAWISAGIALLSFSLLGILLRSAINTYQDYSPARISLVKRHMHQLKAALATYALEHDKQYPVSLNQLQASDFAEKGWFETQNPFDPSLPAHLTWCHQKLPGTVCYLPLRTARGISHYQIYGHDKLGQPIQDKGQSVILRPSLP
jgi:hypothetical protein